MRIVVYSARPYDESALKAVSGNHELVFTDKRLTAATASYADGCLAAALFTSDDASATVLEKLYACGVRFILLRSVGYDHVDLAKASSLGMRVANVPEYSPYSVAEHAVAMLMAVNRKIVRSQQLLALQDFRIDSLKGFDIHGKTVGVIGTGKIGVAFIRIMLGFGATVMAFDPQQNAEAESLGVRYVSFEELLRSCDVVSLHCPLTPSTRHLFSAPQFELMKQGAILINTARGAIVNTADLVTALASGRLGAVCLDVYEFEKGLFFEDHSNEVIHDASFIRLRSFSNVLMTGHQGFLTTDAIGQIAATTMQNANCFQQRALCGNELTTQLVPDPQTVTTN